MREGPKGGRRGCVKARKGRNEGESRPMLRDVHFVSQQKERREKKGVLFISCNSSVARRGGFSSQSLRSPRWREGKRPREQEVCVSVAKSV